MRQAQNLILGLSGRPTHRSRRPDHSPPARNHPRQSPIALTATTFAPLTCPPPPCPYHAGGGHKKAERTGPSIIAASRAQLHCRWLEPFGRLLNRLVFVAGFDLAEAR